MLRRVEISNFRGFHALDVPCGAVTGIIGKNSAGKTSVLHAIRVVNEAFRLALADESIKPRVRAEDHVIEVCTKEVVADPARLVPLADWRQLFTDASVGEGVFLAIQLTFDPDDALHVAHFELRYGRNAQILMTLHVRSDRVAQLIAALPAKSGQRQLRLRGELERIAPQVVFVPAFYGVTRLEEYRTQPVVDRLLGGGDQSHIVRNLVARLDGIALERMNEFLGRTLQARIVQRTGQQDAEDRSELVVTYRDSNGELELSSAGAGLVSLVALYAALERIRKERALNRERAVIFLLDEPEAHLHPRLQGDVGEELAKVAKEFGVQLLLATHSVEMVNRLGRQPETVLLSVDRTSSTAVVLESESARLAALDAFCDLSPFTSLSFLASRRILFHEGPSDWKALEACALVYFRSDPARAQEFKRYTPVSLDGVGNAPGGQVLRKVLSPELFPKLDTAHPVRAVMVMDRDYTRAPKLTSSSVAPHFEAIEAVWSRHCVESLFLDAECLTSWLREHVPEHLLNADALQEVVVKAIAEANADQGLEDEAYEGRYPFHRRPKDDQILTEKAAGKATREEVRASPETWHRGKKRAAFVLDKVRSGLPREARGAVRGSLIDLLVGAARSSVGDPLKLVPQEVRALLDRMVAPGATGRPDRKNR